VKSTSLPSSSSKSEAYHSLARQLRALFEGESDTLANAANMASLVYHALPEVNWAGFYRFQGGQLVLGPFQGKPACARLSLGKGVCGTAAAERKSLVVPNVHEFSGHIACDSASASEIVIPVVAHDRLVGVFDVDSPVLNRFDAEDRAGLESLVGVLLAAIRESLPAKEVFCD
jgi:L-methionine (R)-S-oxide reductase